MALQTGNKTNSRFQIDSKLKECRPWTGYRATDLLNGNNYHLFSLSLPENLSISLEDLKMRNRLFSRTSSVNPPVLSLENEAGKIIFLLPSVNLKGLNDTLKSAGAEVRAKLLREITGTVIPAWKSGLYFSNLTLESIGIIEGSPVILPTAYLLPRKVIELITFDSETAPHPLLSDLAGLSGIFGQFAEFFDGVDKSECADIADELETLSGAFQPEGFFRTMSALGSFAGIESRLKILPAGPEWMVDPFEGFEDKIRTEASRIKSGGGRLIILEGKNGAGKSSLLKIAEKILVKEEKVAGKYLQQDEIFSAEAQPGPDSFNKPDCFFIDDHLQEPILCCYIAHRASQLIKKGKSVICAVGEDTPVFFTESMEAECAREQIPISKIEIPFPDESKKRALFSKRVESGESAEIMNSINLNQKPVWIDYCLTSALKGCAHEGAFERGMIMRCLTERERSVLNFIAVFRFEIPLAILTKVYSIFEDEFYEILQKLINLGLVTESFGRSSLSGCQHCLLFGLSSRTLINEILKSDNGDRQKQLHSNIAVILKEKSGMPPAYNLYHLASSGEKAVAAARCYETFRRFLGNNQGGAVECLFRSFVEMGLDRHLPVEMYSKLLIKIGTHFSNSGQFLEARKYFEDCRRIIEERDQGRKLRSIMVEAIRKECEILEKRGDFLKAEQLLEGVIDTHSEHCTTKERCRLLNDLAWVYYRLGQFDESWKRCLKVQKLLDKKQCPSELAQSYNLMGTINWNRSRYEEAVLCHAQCLNLREESNDMAGIASSFNNLGLVYRSTGRINEAIDSFTKSMKIKQKINNLPGLAAAHLNISLTYLDIEDFEKAKEDCETACRLAEDTGNQQLLGEAYGTLGEIYFRRGDYSRARDYYFRDLHICRETKSIREEAVILRRMAQLHLENGDMDKAETLLEKAGKLNVRIGSHLETALLNELEGQLQIKKGRLKSGLEKLEGASLELSLLGRKNVAARIAAELGELYLAENNEPLAREYLLRSISLAEKNQALPARIENLERRLNRISDPAEGASNSGERNYMTLCRAISMIRTIKEPEKLHDNILKIAIKITGYDRGFIALRTGPSGGYTILASSLHFKNKELIEDENINSVINIARQLGYTLDTSRISIPLDKVSDRFVADHPRILCVPLKFGGDVKGCLYLDSRKPGVSSKLSERSLLLALTQQLATGLERSLMNKIISSPSQSAASGDGKKPGTTANYENIIRQSASMAAVCELVDGVKEMDTTVLLTGKSGSGKDLIAKTIHYTSSRKDFPFHSINCSALPRELLESELFGHEKGSFTGAHKQKIGHFESAGRGTIFLNEIGDLPLDLQPKLLHTIEERYFFRVGGTKKIKTAARIITATNKDLKELVKRGKFREDLYYRINIFPIPVPPLKERKEDIEPLCSHFLDVYCKLYDTPPKNFSPEAMMCIKKYHWPGNVRQLESTIIRLVIVTENDVINVEDLPENIVQYTRGYNEEISTNLEDRISELIENTGLSPTDPILPRIESIIIKKVVEKTGNIKKSAAFLGISKPTLYKRLKKQ